MARKRTDVNKEFLKMPDHFPVAIIGMGCLFPKATGLTDYWHLLYHAKDAITEIPASHWSPADYFDADPKKPDHVYCKRGGFISPIAFDPLEFGITPASLDATDTSQLLGLLAAKMALEDCGYRPDNPDFDRDRASVILGVTGTQELVMPLSSRLGYPVWRKALENALIPPEKTEEIIRTISDSYVPWKENSFPGLLGNVVAGRICNRLDLRGTNCVVDAACASSLSAIHLAVLELISGRSDLVLTGGVDTLNDIFMHMCFSKTNTLSITGDARPFSKDADGTVLGEGIGILVLKRLSDAEKDGNRIYAVIRGLGSSSDGKSQSIYAPRVEGQIKALRAAYRNAGIDPATVELIEAHGTGTRVGDSVEFEALKQVFGASGADGRKCALGSVKSMIGHTKAAAGAAGLIKAALGLYHKVLPPTLKANEPDPALSIEKSRFYLNTSSRPWLSVPDHPRRAGVSAFGFGGSNFHIVLEEYRGAKQHVSWDGSIDIIAVSANSENELIRELKSVQPAVGQSLSEGEFSAAAAASRQKFSSQHPFRLLTVCDRDADKSDLFDRALTALGSGYDRTAKHLRDVYIGVNQNPGKLAFVFPGQGSQYVGMGRDLVCTFPGAADVLAMADDKFKQAGRLSDLIFPRGGVTDNERQRQADALKNTDVAQPAIGAVSLAMISVLQMFAIAPDAVCGHSFGELTALCAAGWIDAAAFLDLSVTRGYLMARSGDNTHGRKGAMLAVQAPLADLERLAAGAGQGVVVANRNSPTQGVLSGPATAIAEIAAICRAKKIKAIPLPVSAAFHSQQVEGVCRPFLRALNKIRFTPGAVPVFSNTTGDRYPDDPDKARALLAEHLIRPVEFVREIENLFNSGVRTFVEVGPKSVLTGLISAILRDHDFTAVALDGSAGKGYGVRDLAGVLCQLAALGYPVALEKWENPVSSLRESKMNVRLSGTNYIGQTAKNRTPSPENSGQTPDPRDLPAETRTDNCHVTTAVNPDGRNLHSANPLNPVGAGRQTSDHNKHHGAMKQDQRKPSKFISEALAMVQEGLKSIQSLQSQTAQAHQKFLESQAEANRTLREMMANTRQLIERSLGIDARPPHSPATEKFAAPLPQEVLPQPNGAMGTLIAPAARHRPEPQNSAKMLLTTVGRQSREVAANGYSKITSTHDAHPKKPNRSCQAREGIEATMLAVVSQLTGYPVEMLGLDMDIEADLGIDSIKRVEILSTLEEKMPGLPAVSPEIMGTLKTLRQIAAFIAGADSRETEETEPASMVSHESNLPNDTIPEQPSDSRNRIEATMLAVVSQLTGYPVEMLGLDMDIEADLGIDSIKRVEILSTLEEKMPGLPAVSPEIMGTLKTLRQIAAYLSNDQAYEASHRPLLEEQPTAFDRLHPDDKEPSLRRADVPTETTPDKIPRSVVTAVDAPLSTATPIDIDRNRKVFVTEDNTGLSEEIANELAKLGINTVRISLDILNYKKQLPKAAGLVIVQDPASPKMEQDIKDAFSLTKYVAPDLILSAKNGGALFATVTRIDGAFGLRRREIENPVQGGLAGLVKTAAVEWDQVCCHAVDIAPDWHDRREIATAIVREILSPGPIEIGLDSKSRHTLVLESRPFPEGGLNLNPKDVVVISGGARGITFAAARALASAVKPTLVLLGRSPYPAAEPTWLSSLEDEAAMKKAILENDFSGKSASPVEIENAYRGYRANREIAANLADLKSTGAEVAYYSADVRDLEAVETVMTEVRSRYGGITAIVHGAGVLEDRRILDKTRDQFERVFDTKVLGLKNLLRAARSDNLTHIVLFSSIAARFGNMGQVDYAAANEVLNKIAGYESLNRPDCLVVSINWGPWEGGMVSAALKREFERREISMIPMDSGADCLLREMQGRPGQAIEVVIGARMRDHAKVNITNVKQLVAVKAPALQKKRSLSLSFEREIDIHTHPILKSHVIDGKPVVPLALITEWFAHAALHENPGLRLHGLDEIRILKGIRLERNTQLVRLLAGKPRKKGAFYEVDLELRDGVKDGKDVIHSRATAVLTDRLAPAPDFKLSNHLDSETYSRKVEDIYARILFHGDQLHGLRRIVRCSARGMVAHISTAPPPKEWISAPLRNQWIMDPLVLDSAFQMATLWCFEEKGSVSLPSYGSEYRQYCHQFPADRVTAVLEVKEATERKMRGDFTFLDKKDEVLAQLIGYETVMDASLIKAFKPQYRASA